MASSVSYVMLANKNTGGKFLETYISKHLQAW